MGNYAKEIRVSEHESLSVLFIIENVPLSKFSCHKTFT